MKRLGLTISCVMTALMTQGSRAQTFKGGQVAIEIAFGAGGTYDQYAQLFARHLGAFLPGHPTVIVESMPGAGGVRMLDEAASRFPRDGSRIFMPPDTTVVSQLLEKDGIRFDARAFIYLGTADQENVFLATRRSRAASLDDLRKHPTYMGSSGAGSTGFLIPSIAGPLLGLKTKPVGGYQGSRDIILGMERSEVDGSAQGWQVWRQARPQWFEGSNSFAVPIFQVGTTPDPSAPKVPLLSSLVAKKDRSMVAVLNSIGVIGRSLAMPSDVPQPVVAEFRAAFSQMVKDSAFKQDAAATHLRSVPRGPEHLKDGIAAAISGADASVIAQARKYIKQ